MPTSLSPLALTIGDPAGIGPDIALAAWAARKTAAITAFSVVGDPDVLASRARALGIDLRLRVEEQPSGVAPTHEALAVLPVTTAARVAPGRPDPRNGASVIEAIRRGAGE